MPILHNEPEHLARSKAEIEALDLSMVRRKLAHRGEGPGWTPEHADRVERAYRQFLMVLAGHPGTVVAPTRDIDTFWHAHILDTRRYADDCQRIFGEFLHHDPYLGLRNDELARDHAAAALHELFDIDFGEQVPANAASWCGGEVGGKREASWCGGEVGAKEEAAWCGGEVGAKKEAAWCGGEVGAKKEAAWCGGEVAAKKEIAWCGGEVGRPAH